MQLDFHYYATYSAAIIAGYTHEESISIAFADQYTDCCTKALLSKLNADLNVATTQLCSETVDTTPDIFGLQDITRIWASFHFLPQNLYLELPKKTKLYMQKRRMVCGPNGDLVVKTVNLAKDKSLEAIGIAMHVLADTWAHRNFAGTPSFVMNNVNSPIYDVRFVDGEEVSSPVNFTPMPGTKDNVIDSVYQNTVYSENENSVMNLGHGRIGHLPDISCLRYRYLTAWGEYDLMYKDNPDDYYHAFCQMVYALMYLKGSVDTFEKETYAWDKVKPYEDEIKGIITKMQPNANDDWKVFAEKLSGQTVKDFDMEEYDTEYLESNDKANTYLGRFFVAALNHKRMVTESIIESGNKLAGASVEKKDLTIKNIADSAAFMTGLNDGRRR